MNRTKLNTKTNSLYEEKEKEFLENINFSWSNKSMNTFQEGDNCLYRYHNGYFQEIEVRNKNFKLLTVIPTHIGTKDISITTSNFDEIKQKISLSFQNKIILFLYKLNTIPFIFLWLFTMLLISPFIKQYSMKEKYKRIIKKGKKAFCGDYFFLNESLPFIWGLNLFFLGSIIMYIILK